MFANSVQSQMFLEETGGCARTGYRVQTMFTNAAQSPMFWGKRGKTGYIVKTTFANKNVLGKTWKIWLQCENNVCKLPLTELS